MSIYFTSKYKIYPVWSVRIIPGHKTCHYGELLVETEYWLVLLAPDQRNLGTCIVALKRDENSLSSLKKKEWIEFVEIVSILESALKKAFPVTLFNWGCHLNSRYQRDHTDCHLHWHLIPRYKNPVQLGGHTFQDPCFGESTMKATVGSFFPSEDLKGEIVTRIREHLKDLNRKKA